MSYKYQVGPGFESRPGQELSLVDRSSISLMCYAASTVGLGWKHFFDLSRKQNLLRKVPQFSRNFVNFSRKFFMKTFRQKFSRKPQSDEKWYKISVEKEYMEPDPWFFGLLDPDPSDLDPVWILVLFEENRSGSWSYLRIRISGKIPWIRTTDMEIFFRLMNVKRCFCR
jgi:hypothetical protein